MKFIEQKLVSIITPLYNCEKYLERCINSVINQTYDCFELILVDDGSTDASGIIAQKYENKCKKIKYIKKCNGGPASARNVGLFNASGMYVAFLDADDYLKPDYLQKMVSAVESNNAEVAVCGFDQQDSVGKVFNSYKPSYRVFEFKKEYVSKQFVPFVVWQLMVKRSLLSDYKIFFNENLFVLEDLLFIYNVLLKSKKTIYLDSILYVNCVREDSFVHECFNSSCSEKLLGKLQAFDEIDVLTEKYEVINKDIQLLAIKEATLLSHALQGEENKKIRTYIKKYVKKLMNKKLSFKEKMIVLVCRYMPCLYVVFKGRVI